MIVFFKKVGLESVGFDGYYYTTISDVQASFGFGDGIRIGYTVDCSVMPLFSNSISTNNLQSGVNSQAYCITFINCTASNNAVNGFNFVSANQVNLTNVVANNNGYNVPSYINAGGLNLYLANYLSNATITNSVFSNNIVYGIYIYAGTWYTNYVLQGNTISQNVQGGAYFENSDVTASYLIENNTFSYNYNTALTIYRLENGTYNSEVISNQ